VGIFRASGTCGGPRVNRQRDRVLILRGGKWSITNELPSTKRLCLTVVKRLRLPDRRRSSTLHRRERETGHLISTMDQICHAVSLLDLNRLLIAHCTSTYPCKPEELNLRVIEALRNEFGCPIGYSGREVGLQTTYAAVVLGACFVERHITLDRAMWGSDQAASVEPHGFARLVRPCPKNMRVIFLTG